MTPVKRIEILTGAQEFPLIEQALKSNGITGYDLLHDVRGKGDRRLESVDPLTGQAEGFLIKTACLPEDVNGVVEALRPILNRYGGSCFVYDAECMILHHHHDVMAGGGGRAGH
jgi:hypothetical protein